MPAFTPDKLAALTSIAVTADTRDDIFRDLPALSYQSVGPAKTAELLAEIEQVIAQRQFRMVGEAAAQNVWEKGWGEVAARLASAKDVTIDTLKPQYFHSGAPLRFLGEYIIPGVDFFEYYAGIAVRRQLMLRYFQNSGSIVELGCGTGINLLLAADLFPDASLTGADWTQATFAVLANIGRTKGRNIAPALFNMLDLSGRDDLPISAQTDVLTVHALEQLGQKATPVLEWLIGRRPRRCLHIEPIVDLYDARNSFDEIALRYHRARNYLDGFFGYLKQRADDGAIRITATGRVKLGNMFHEAYSYVVWEPLPREPSP